jgi:MYXO-CTERM domain-containing protein
MLFVGSSPPPPPPPAAGALWLVGLGWAVSIVRWADALPT